MKIFEVAKRADQEGGEFVLGSADTGTHACYMIYGTIAPHAEGRLIKPGAGHEELLMVTAGELKLSGPGIAPGIAPVSELTLPEGSAVLLQGDMECFLRNDTQSPAAYVCSGGHTPGGKHGH